MKNISTNSFCRNMAEQRLLVAAWRDPATFYREVVASGLAGHHIEDRLVDYVLAYLIGCAKSGETPRLSTFERATRELAIPYGRADFHRVFVETTIPADMDMTRLIDGVMEFSEERAQRFAAEQVVDHLRAVKHVQTCPQCIRCINGHRKRPASTPKRNSWRAVEYAGDC
jgi:hypothetical protein